MALPSVKQLSWAARMMRHPVGTATMIGAAAGSAWGGIDGYLNAGRDPGDRSFGRRRWGRTGRMALRGALEGAGMGFVGARVESVLSRLGRL